MVLPLLCGNRLLANYFAFSVFFIHSTIFLMDELYIITFFKYSCYVVPKYPLLSVEMKYVIKVGLYNIDFDNYIFGALYWKPNNHESI